SAARAVKLLLPGIPNLRRDGSVQSDGTFVFTDVSATSFTITATDLSGSALKGAVSDALHAGESKQGELIVLQPTGSLSLTAQFENGSPAPGSTGDLLISGKHFFAQSDSTGALAYDVVPLGDYSLALEDPLGIGIAHRVGTLVGPVSLGVVTLDSSRPAVAQITPAALSTGVAHDQPITIVFSEAIQPATATTTNIIISDATGQVTGTVALRAGDTTATFTPL